MEINVGDMDFLATATDVNEVLDCFVSLPIVGRVDGRGANKATVILNNGLQVDLYVMDPKYYSRCLQHFTGSRDHNIALRDRAIKMGMKLNEYGLHRNDGTALRLRTRPTFTGRWGWTGCRPRCARTGAR